MPNITKPLLQTLRTEMQAALNAVAQKHGIAINVGSCKFSDTTADFKLSIATGVVVGDPLALRKAQAADLFKRTAYLPVPKSALHTQFKFGAHTYRLEGCIARSGHYLCSRDNGGTEALYKMPEESVIAGLLVTGVIAAPVATAHEH